MLISIEDHSIINTEGFQEYRAYGYRILCDGIAFFRGMKAGKETLEEIARQQHFEGNIQYSGLYGTYAIVLTDGEKIIAFSDNSHMHGILVSARCVGSNMVEMGRYEGSGLDEVSVCEYLTFTRPVFSKSLIKGIELLPADKYALISGGKIEQKSKDIGTIKDEPRIDDVILFFEDMTHAIRDYRVITALTGGYDSRLVAAVYHYYCPGTECFISGDNVQGADIKRSREAAEAAGMKWNYISPPAPNAQGSDLIRKIYLEGGYKAEINTSGYRINYFMKRLCEDYDVVLTGDAGDMHKLFWDNRTFPFLPRWKKADMEKMARKYFLNPKGKEFLGDKLQKVYDHIVKETYELFRKSRQTGYRESMLSAGWNDWVPMGLRCTECGKPMLYSPLQEFELVRYSYNHISDINIMKTFYRRLISYYCPEMARVKTIYGTNCSDKAVDISLDYIRTIFHYLGLALNYLSKKTLKFDFKRKESVNSMCVFDMVRDSGIADEAARWAVEKGYVKKACLEKGCKMNLGEELFRKVIYLYMTECDLKGTLEREEWETKRTL